MGADGERSKPRKQIEIRTSGARATTRQHCDTPDSAAFKGSGNRFTSKEKVYSWKVAHYA